MGWYSEIKTKAPRGPGALRAVVGAEFEPPPAAPIEVPAARREEARITVRALICGRFSGLELAILVHVLTHARYEPLELNAVSLGQALGEKPFHVQGVVWALHSGHVLRRVDREWYRLNPEFWEWRDDRRVPRITQAHWPYILEGRED